MSACSGRNYNFRCINVVFGVFLRETARPVAKSRTSLAQIKEKLPNLAHMCRFIWEWIYAKQIALRGTGGTWGGGGLGGQTFKSQGKLSNGWTDWHQLWFTSADSSGNGHRLNTSHTSITHGACRGGGGLGGHTFKSLGKLSNGWTDWLQMWYMSADSSRNGHRLNTIHPSTWGVRGSQIQKSGEDVKRLVRLASNLVHMSKFIWEWIYAKQIALRDTGGTWGGGVRGSNIQKSGEAVKRLDRLAPTLVHVCGFFWEWA